MEDAIINLKAAGIVVVVSAGNEGRDGCGTVARPPAMFESSFAIGATRDNDTIADFSSRGPVLIDSSFRLKPDVSAPGHNIRSSVRNGEFNSFSGTSMAGPHVVGAVALIINANPSLRGRVEIIEDILLQSAVNKFADMDCFDFLGQNTPNHVYGAGRINVLKAVELAQVVSTTEDQFTRTFTFKIYPNPANDFINIETNQIEFTDYKISLYNIEGQLITTKSNSPKNLSLDGISNGTYIVKLESKEKAAFEKLVVAF
jgi:subtilisin family serine protease